jgi:hypothetical protein
MILEVWDLSPGPLPLGTMGKHPERVLHICREAQWRPLAACFCQDAVCSCLFLANGKTICSFPNLTADRQEQLDLTLRITSTLFLVRESVLLLIICVNYWPLP